MEASTQTSVLRKNAGPLGDAYFELRRSTTSPDSLNKQTVRGIWRLLWARYTTVSWLELLESDPSLFSGICRIIPDEKELLEAIKASIIETLNAEKPVTQQNKMANGLLGLVNDRLTKAKGPVIDYRSSAKVRQNYSGHICAGIREQNGPWVAGTPELPATTPLPPQTACQLIVWFQPERPSGPWCERMMIQTGIDDDLMEFAIEVDCPTMFFTYGRKQLRFHRSLKSSSISFYFMTADRVGDHYVRVHVFQGGQVLSTLSILIRIARAAPAESSTNAKHTD